MKNKILIGLIVVFLLLVFFLLVSGHRQTESEKEILNIEEMSLEEIVQQWPRMTPEERLRAQRKAVERAKKAEQKAKSRLEYIKKKAMEEGLPSTLLPK